ncbi:MAG: cysteine desulfurase [Candidatus Giovannonibacteria bacterium]|nr:MAG: cysteine desulfurase [Candidatus Giovannonibacteria bacterium]
MRRVYLDHAATTPTDQRVKEAMNSFWTEEFGNAGGLYEEGRLAKNALVKSRETIARIIGARPEEIIFTSGGTESDNLAIFGVAFGAAPLSSKPGFESAKKPGFFPSGAIKPHIITTKFEHHAVLEPCQQLAKENFDVTFLDVGEDGIVKPENVKRSLRPETILVSIMYANNEIGTVQPIAEIGNIIREFRAQNKSAYPYFHTDACQAAGYLDLNVNPPAGGLGVDLMTVNGSKIYGPKGIGFLYRKMGVKIKPQIIGGGQEMRMRSGTEPVALIVGLAKALEIAQAERFAESARLTPLRDYFIAELQKRVPKVILNGHPTKRLPNNINVSILDIEGEALVLYLDAKGISFSTGSACTSESLEPSHVILALGKPYEFAHASMRFTMGRGTTKEEVDYVLSELPSAVEWLRKVSPLNLKLGAKSMSHPEAFAGENLKVKAKSQSYK